MILEENKLKETKKQNQQGMKCLNTPLLLLFLVFFIDLLFWESSCSNLRDGRVTGFLGESPCTPLRVILPTDVEGSVQEEGELVEGRELVVSQSGDLAGEDEEEGKEDDHLREICLMRFSKVMGLTIQGFEDEIVDLMTRIIKNRIKGAEKGTRRLTKFDRAMKNLEWTIKEKGGNRGDTSIKGVKGSKSVF